MRPGCRRPPSLSACRLLLGLHRDAWIVLEEREPVALGVDARGEPTLSRDRLPVVGLAAEVANLSDGRVDVVCVEVYDRTRSVLHWVHRAAGAHAIGEVVIDPRDLGVLVLPSEERAVETLRAIRILRVDLEVNNVACHWFLTELVDLSVDLLSGIRAS